MFIKCSGCIQERGRTNPTDQKKRQAFTTWLRTGRWPAPCAAPRLALKFNPWHDSANGRFTSPSAGSSGGDATRGGNVRPPAGPARRPGSTLRPNGAGATSSTRASPWPAIGGGAVRFTHGAIDGVYDSAAGAVAGIRSALTSPVATARRTGKAIASTIDAVVEAEGTPASVQLSRAAAAIGQASAYDIGHAAGSTVGNVALTVAPEAALSKLSVLRDARAIPPKPSFDPPQIGWVKENLGKDTPAKRYNDAAIGARPGQAPTLMRTLADGSKRPVKFDGVQGDYVIDRKIKVVDRPNAIAQALRQSQALEQNRLLGTWEVPNGIQKTKALNLFRKLGIRNIRVRIVKS